MATVVLPQFRIMDLILVEGHRMTISVVVKCDSQRVYHCPLTIADHNHVVEGGAGYYQRTAANVPVFMEEGVRPIAKGDEKIPFGNFSFFMLTASTQPRVRIVPESFLTPSEKEAYEFFKSHI